MNYRNFLKIREKSIIITQKELGENFDLKDLNNRIDEYIEAEASVDFVDLHSVNENITHLTFFRDLYLEIKKQLDKRPGFTLIPGNPNPSLLEQVKAVTFYNFLSRYYYKNYDSWEKIIHTPRKNVLSFLERKNINYSDFKSAILQIKRVKNAYEELLKDNKKRYLTAEDFFYNYVTCYDIDIKKLAKVGFENTKANCFDEAILSEFLYKSTFNSMKSLSIKEKHLILNTIHENLSEYTIKDDYKEFTDSVKALLKNHQGLFKKEKEKQLKKLEEVQKKIDCIEEVDLTF